MNEIKLCNVITRTDHCIVVKWDDTDIQFPAAVDTGVDSVYVEKKDGTYVIVPKPKRKTKKETQSLDGDSE